MTATEDILPPMDVPATIEHLVAFLRSELERTPRRHGYVIGISGGIDSAVVAALCVRAAGGEHVHALMLPERESSADGRRVAREVISALGVSGEERDITPILEAAGVYRDREDILRTKIEGFDAGWTYRLVLPGDLRESAAMNVYQLEAYAPDGRRSTARLRPAELRAIQAATNVKQRVRMIELYRAAEERAYLVAGTTNRTELETGFFVRHGDGGVDVEPLANLLKTHVYALARELGLPDSVIDRPPSPDTWSAPVSDEEYFLRLPYEVVDRILAGADHEDEELARVCGLEPSVLRRAREEIARRTTMSSRLRELPPTPEVL